MVLEVEIDDERLQRSLDQAYRRLAPRTRVPGFRPGKAPRPLVERALGHDRLLQEAVDRLLPEAYEEAVQAQGLDPIGAPELEVLQMEPVRFKATVPLQPEVGLGAYQSLSMKREAVEITEEQIEVALLEIRRRHAILEPVDRPLQYNDRLTVDIRAEVDGRLVLNQDGAEVHLREGMTLAVPGLAEGLVGRGAGPGPADRGAGTRRATPTGRWPGRRCASRSTSATSDRRSCRRLTTIWRRRSASSRRSGCFATAWPPTCGRELRSRSTRPSSRPCWMRWWQGRRRSTLPCWWSRRSTICSRRWRGGRGGALRITSARWGRRRRSCGNSCGPRRSSAWSAASS